MLPWSPVEIPSQRFEKGELHFISFYSITFFFFLFLDTLFPQWTGQVQLPLPCWKEPWIMSTKMISMYFQFPPLPRCTNQLEVSPFPIYRFFLRGLPGLVHGSFIGILLATVSRN